MPWGTGTCGFKVLNGRINAEGQLHKIRFNGNSHQTLLLGAPKNNVAGGRAYDAVIGACAEQGKATTVLTFNARDFAALGQRYDLVVAGTIKRAFGNQAPRAACARGAVMQTGQPLISIAQKLGGLRRFFPEHPPRVP